jgi:hypothetical protein
VSHTSNIEEDSSERSAEEDGDDEHTSYAQEKLCGKRLAVAAGPAKKRRKTGVSTHVPKKPVVIGGESPRWRRQLVLTSSSEDDVPVLPPSSPLVMEEVPSAPDMDVDLGGSAGAGPIMAVLTPVPEGPTIACPAVEVLSAAFPEEGAPEA